MDGFALEEFADSRTDRLSMGQRQRLRLSLAFMDRPQLVLLDEPCNSLDENAISILTAAITVLLNRGGCVVWVSPGRDAELYQFDEQLQLVRGRLTS